MNFLFMNGITFFFSYINIYDNKKVCIRIKLKNILICLTYNNLMYYPLSAINCKKLLLFQEIINKYLNYRH